MGLAEIVKARDAIEAGDLRETLGKYHRDPDTAFLGWNGAWLDPECDVGNVAGVLDDIRVPVLAIQRRDDPYGTLDQIDVVSRRVRHGPVSTLILDGCWHAPHLQLGPAVIAAIAVSCKSAVRVGTVDTTRG